LQNISVSPDGKLLAVLGDSSECLIADANNGKVLQFAIVFKVLFSLILNVISNFINVMVSPRLLEA